MKVIFRETNMENKRDNESIVLLLNEFMNRNDQPNSTEKIDISIIGKLKKLSTTKIYLCENCNDIIGIAVCFIGFSTYKQRELLNIHDFFIRKEWQGKGIGKKFLQYIDKECVKNNLCRVTLEVYGDNTNAIKLYNQSGYIGNENSQNNCLIFAMKKDLS